MNYFTIEELAVLKHALNTNIDGYKDPYLLNKIQSLIENYCEHEWGNICCGCSLDSLGCNKCYKRFTEI